MKAVLIAQLCVNIHSESTKLKCYHKIISSKLHFFLAIKDSIKILFKKKGHNFAKSELFKLI